jgi:uncharacterized repeat protein (TIGR01451 family)
MDPKLADLYCNGSRVTPEFAAVINPPSVKSLQVASTPDEGNNYVALRFGPLTTSKPTDANGAAYTAFGDYHLTRASNSAIDQGAPLSSSTPFNHDVDGDKRPGGAGFDIGADEIAQAPATTDLAVTKTVNVPSAAKGGTVIFKVTVSNTGSTVAGAVVADTRSTNFSSWNWSCAPAAQCGINPTGTGNISQTLGSLASGNSVTFTIKAVIRTGNSVAVGTVISNTATVTAPATVTDSNPSNNSASASVTVANGANNNGAADSVAPNSLGFGTVARNSITVRNVTVTNTGSVALGITDINIAGFPNTMSVVAPAAGANPACVANTTILVANGAKCDVGVQYAPTARGGSVGALTVSSNATDKTAVVTGTSN